MKRFFDRIVTMWNNKNQGNNITIVTLITKITNYFSYKLTSSGAICWLILFFCTGL